MKPNIIRAIEDPKLFRAFVTGDRHGDLASWANWIAFLKVLYGLRLRPGSAEADVARACTGRDPDRLPRDGFDECLLLCGRRSGKSKVIALVAAAEACLSGREAALSPGEIGMVSVVSPTRFQSRIIHKYMRAVFASSPMLEGEVAKETREGFRLKSGVEIAVMTGSHQSARGFTQLATVIDEAAFFGLTEESKVKNDTELIRALRPALATTGGRLLVVTTPYKEAGYVFNTYRRCFGDDRADVLVWNAASLTMNPTLRPSVVERAVAEDPIAASVEYQTSPGLFRSDVDEFVSRETVEALVVRGRAELPPAGGARYHAFADVSGGRSDDAALAIAHRDGRLVVLDALQRFKAPHDPYAVVARMVETIRRYGCDRATGDAYAAEWTRLAFESHGIFYNRASTSAWHDGAAAFRKVAKPKSVLYGELLPRLTAGEVELLDNETLVAQLASLQRRTRSGARDSIDHPPGGHDDLANAVAGVVDLCFEVRAVAGVGEHSFRTERQQGGGPPRAVRDAMAMQARLDHAVRQGELAAGRYGSERSEAFFNTFRDDPFVRAMRRRMG